MIDFKTNYRFELAPTLTGHWWSVFEIKPNGKEKFLGHKPSVTTILNAYPQSLHLTRWIGEKGNEEADKIKSEAGIRGTNVHNAIEILLKGGELAKDSFTLDEWNKICAFVNWHTEYRPEILGTEIPVFSKKHGYAGRFDCLAKVDGRLTVADWKTSGSLYEHFPLQFAAYAQALEENTDLKIDQTAALQLGTRSKIGYRYVEYPDWKEHFKVFKNVQKTWQYDFFDSKTNEKEPPVLILPDKLKLV